VKSDPPSFGQMSRSSLPYLRLQLESCFQGGNPELRMNEAGEVEYLGVKGAWLRQGEEGSYFEDVDS